MTRPRSEADDDAKRCYELALTASRERRIRRGEIPPELPHEHQWAEEGERPVSKLSTVKAA